MKRLYYTNKRMICIFAVLFIIGVYATTNTYPIKLLHHVSAFCYLTIIILWAATIRIRIVDKEVRVRILVSCAFMVLLFFLRMCKYTYFPEDAMIREYIWYSYMIPRTFFPLFMFTATLYVEPVGSRRMVRRIEIILIIISTLFAAVAMTNNLHSLVYKITVHPDKEYTHEIFYYILMAWRIALTVGLLVILFRKCSLSSARRKWYIPVICIAVSSILLLWYNIYGGAPKVWGYKLFQLQEALCIPYMMAFESIIQIGMIPANNGYRKLFEHSGINACIFDKDGNPVQTSLGWSQTGQDDDHRISKEPVSGGYITWIEDISAINRLNRELEEVAEELRDENDLIIQERFGRTVDFGIGVHWGPAVIGNVGAPKRMDYTAIGDTINTAARLEANAPGGQVLISRVVADILGDRAVCTSLGDSIRLKGKAEGFEILRLEKLIRD